MPFGRRGRGRSQPTRAETRNVHEIYSEQELVPSRMPLLTPLDSSVFNHLASDVHLKAQLMAAYAIALKTHIRNDLLEKQVEYHCRTFRKLKTMPQHCCEFPPWHIPSKLIPLHTHDAAVVLEIPVSLPSVTDVDSELPLFKPSIVDEPLIHLFDDNLFIRATTREDRTESAESRFLPWLSLGSDRLSSVLHFAIVVRTPESSKTVGSSSSHKKSFSRVNLTSFDPCDRTMPWVFLQLTIAGVLSWHWISDRTCIQLVLHQPVKSNVRVRAKLYTFLAWLRHYAGASESHSTTPVDHRIQRSPVFTQQWVYDAIRRLPSDVEVDKWIPHMDTVERVKDLHVTLRPYQKRAVAWMLWRELAAPSIVYDDVSLDEENQHDLSDDFNVNLREDTRLAWNRCRDLKPLCPLNNSRNFVNLVDEFAFHAPSSQMWLGHKAQTVRRSVRLGYGGLLCDEMGLGKTVEVMQLVLCNKPDMVEIQTTNASLPALSHHTVHHRRPVDIWRCLHCHKAVSDSNHRCVECGGRVHPKCAAVCCRNERMCFKCSKKLGKLSNQSTPASELPMSKATLIVVPTSLLLQWKDEIDKHVKQALDIVTFQGLARSGYIPLARLIKADVVLTTYDALQSDVNIVSSLRQPRENMRHERLYFPTPVTLLVVRWHRLALDESQMLGVSSNTNAFEMAKFIHARNRWCVTGTPITANSLANSVPMLSLLGSFSDLGDDEPIDIADVGNSDVNWKGIIASSRTYPGQLSWLRSTLRKFMWRTAKADISEDELNIPPQIVQVVRTKFGPVERYHYRSLQRDIADAIPTVTRTRGSNFSLSLLTALRQACCHPRIGTSGRQLLNNANGQMGNRRRRYAESHNRGSNHNNCDEDINEDEHKTMMGMDSVLESLIIKSRIEFQDSLRQLIASVNGLAAVGLIHFETETVALDRRIEGLLSAVSYYREALQLTSDNKWIAETDSIQRIHIYYNLDVALTRVADQQRSVSRLVKNGLSEEKLRELQAVGHAVSDADLKKNFEKLSTEYLEEAQTRLQSFTADLEKVSSELGCNPLVDFPSDSCSDDDEDYGGKGEDNEDENEDKGENEDAGEVEDGWTQEDASNTTNHKTAISDGDENEIIVLDDAESINNERSEKSKGPKRRSKVTWWDLAMSLIVAANEEEQFFLRAGELTRPILSAQGGLRLVDRSHSNIRMAGVIIQGELRDLQLSRQKLLDTLKVLPGGREPTDVEVMESGMCGNCREGADGPPCAHCQAESIIHSVEEKLYAVGKEDNPYDELLNDLSGDVRNSAMFENSFEPDLPWAPSRSKSKRNRARDVMNITSQSKKKKRGDGLRHQSELEGFLILLGTVRRTRGYLKEEDPETKVGREKMEARKNKLYKKWTDRLEKVKEELKLAKSVLEAQRSLLANMDELNMARTRLTVLHPEDNLSELSETELRASVKPSEVKTLQISLETERRILVSQTKDKRSKFNYLSSLRKEMEENRKLKEADNTTDNYGEDGERGRKRQYDNTIERCAVCFIDYVEADQLGILECGHMFCRECTKELIKFRRRNPHADDRPSFTPSKVQCPTCRRHAPRSSITYTTVAPKQPSPPKRPRTIDPKKNGHIGQEGGLSSSTGSPGDTNDRAQSRYHSQNNNETKESEGVDATVQNGDEDEDEIQPVRRESDNTNISSSNTSSDIANGIDLMKSTFIDENESEFVNGSIGCKARVIIRLLRGIWRKEQNCKIVIFSEWKEVLSIIQWAMRLNQLPYIDGCDVSDSNNFSKAIAKFRSTHRQKCALLLPVKRAGAGLNLIEANHVILVEPWLDVALERQAVSRVHRIGQTKTTYVHRVVVDGTVEEQVVKLAETIRKEESENKAAGDESIIVNWEDVFEGLHEVTVRDVMETTAGKASQRGISAS